MRTLRTLGIITTASAILLSTSVAFAESGPGSSGDGRSGNDKRPAGLVRPIMASTTASTTPRGEIGEKMRERLQAAREEMKSRLDDRQEKARQRLGDIRDKEKQQKAERLAKQFDTLNTEWTDRFTKTLDHYDSILKRVQTRVASSTVSGNASTTAAIGTAEDAIETARAAVLAQAAKIYTPDVASLTTTTSTTTPSGQEEVMKKFRDAFKMLHTGLFKDLFALRDGPMKDARRAVQNVLQSLEKARGEHSDD